MSLHKMIKEMMEIEIKKAVSDAINGKEEKPSSKPPTPIWSYESEPREVESNSSKKTRLPLVATPVRVTEART